MSKKSYLKIISDDMLTEVKIQVLQYAGPNKIRAHQ